MKIIQKRTILLLITFFIAPVILSFVFVPTASAADPRDTATKKEWYSIVQDCATSERGWNITNYLLWPVRGGIVISSDALRKGNWFHGNANPGTGIGSPLVEKMIDGKYEDGKINCGSQDNKLVQDGVSGVLGLTNYKEVICNRNTGDQLGKIGYGVLGQDNEDNITCNDAFDDYAREDTYFMYLADNAKGYLDDLVTEKTFSGDVPEGALDKLTKVEMYYVLHDAFIYACAQGSGKILTSEAEKDQVKYWISEVQNGETVNIGYSARANPNEEGYVTFFYDRKAKCKDIAANLQQGHELGLFDAYKAAVESGETQEDPNAGNNNEEERNCQNSGGAGSLGWIVCSILDWMSDATKGLYANVVEPALRVEPELFKGGDSIGAEKAWGAFRDFANILFIIVVLIVIFSQLTGYGIDNYGIKKILPKLIIVAILVNLSYLICLLCVDLSNIVGNGVQDLFNNIPTADVAESITLDDDTIEINTNTGDNVGANVGIVAVGLVSGAVGAFAIYSNPALLLTLFVSVLGVLISVLFVFILLAGRKAVIVLLTVISPIAFILYMLPNTKKIYDKWFNLWKAMLIVYPACGLLIGGGNFASKLMLSLPNSSTSAVTIFVAMVVGIVPIFFIPSLIKSAYSALGSIGGTIAGFGGRLSGGATRGMRNSRAYQNTQKRSQDRNQRIRAMRRAGVRLDKDGNVVESRRPTARLRRRIASSDNGFLKFVNRRTGLEASMGQNATEFTKLEAARRGNMAAGNNTDAMNATLAGLAGKESDQRVSDQETLMRAGKVMMGSERLNIDDAKQMESYHRQLLQSANANRAAGNMAGYNSDMDKIKAAQNIMAKSDPGRSSMQRNYQEAIEKGYTGGLSNAASHLKGAHGPDIKAANRAMNSLVEDLAQGVDTASIHNKIDNHTYDIDSISGYNARSLVSADDGALDGLKNSVAAISSMTNENGQNEKRDQLNALIDDALSNKNIQSQPKVEAKLRRIRDDLNRPSGGPYGYDGGGI